MERFLIQVALLLLVSLYAWRKGEWPEKAAAATFIGMLLLDQVCHWLLDRWASYGSIDTTHFSLDALAMAALLIIALKADRYWTLWIAASQLLALTSHLLRAIDVEMDPYVYSIANRAPVWLAIVLVGLGARNVARTNSKGRLRT